MQSGAYQCHKFAHGVVITQITDYGYERVLDVVLLFGDRFDEWKAEVVNHLCAFGKEHGCAAVEAMTRLGLEKTLRPLGWRKKKVLLRKDI